MPLAMDRLLRLAEILCRWGAWFSGALLVLAAVVIGIEVLLRRFLDFSIGGADELSGFALAIGAAWSMAYALLHRAHVRIDSVYVLLPWRLRAALDLAGLALFLGFMGLIAWRGWGVFEQSWAVGARTMSRLATPLALPQFVWVAGLLLFLAVGLLLLFAASFALAQGDIRTAQRLIGSRSVSEELEEELGEAAPAASPPMRTPPVAADHEAKR